MGLIQELARKMGRWYCGKLLWSQAWRRMLTTYGTVTVCKDQGNTVQIHTSYMTCNEQVAVYQVPLSAGLYMYIYIVSDYASSACQDSSKSAILHRTSISLCERGK